MADPQANSSKVALSWRHAAFALGGILAVAAMVSLAVWAAIVEERELSGPVVVQIDPGTPATRIADRLVAEQVIVSAWTLLLYAHVSGTANSFQAGEYEFAGSVSVRSVARQLVEGRVKLHAFTITPGTTVRAVLGRLAGDERLRHSLTGADDQRWPQRLGVARIEELEGRLFPDSYFFARGAADIAIIDRARQAMERELARAWAERDAADALRTPDELLVLASIIEKETAYLPDMGLISGVFHGRLAEGMRLQSDPTVIYALGAAFDGDLTRAHLRTDHPYNTYVTRGLPPTPIAMPGREALAAAARPEHAGYRYFVARGDGTSAFATTLAEHNANVRRYQLGEADP